MTADKLDREFRNRLDEICAKNGRQPNDRKSPAEILAENSEAWRRILKPRWRRQPPYGEMCRDPSLCLDKSYCPRDPTCGD